MIKKRLNIITDSLGMPREVTTPAQTWTELISEKYKGNFIIKQFLRRNLSIEDIVSYLPDYVTYWTPDILIIQIGIVDCCRRAMSKKMRDILDLMSRLRLSRIANIVHKHCRRKHYAITKKKNIHYCDPKQFYDCICKIVTEARREKNCIIAMIAIAAPCYELVEKTYGSIQDAQIYNAVLEQAAKDMHFTVINPYENEEAENIVLVDGHHLTERGHELVEEAVDNFLAPLRI
jgi:hypothetical protein